MDALAAAPVYFTKHSRGLTVFVDGKSISISNDAPTYEAALAALRKKDWKQVKILLAHVPALSMLLSLPAFG